MNRFCFIWILTTMLFGIGLTASAQIPDEFINLKVLPRDIAKEQLVETMKNFTRSLGVRCEFCHVGKAGAPLSTYDFAADTKEEKKVARVMMKMVSDINSNYIGKLGHKGEATVVRCATCHRGVEHPEFLEDLLMETVAGKGVDAAVTEYRELKGRYYGSYSYDFSDRSLNQLGMQLLSQKKPEAAIVFLRLNTGEHPKSIPAHLALSQAYAETGDKQKAIGALEKALALDPDNEEIKKRIEGMKGEEKK